MFGLGHFELMIVGIVAILLFGRKLPEVARSLGSSYRQFKDGLHDLQSQVDVNRQAPSYGSTPSGSKTSPAAYDDEDYYDEAAAPKFEPPPKAEAPQEDI